MATPSSVLAWRISWTEEPGRLQSMRLHRVGHNWSDLAASSSRRPTQEEKNATFHLCTSSVLAPPDLQIGWIPNVCLEVSCLGNNALSIESVKYSDQGPRLAYKSSSNHNGARNWDMCDKPMRKTRLMRKWALEYKQFMLNIGGGLKRF